MELSSKIKFLVIGAIIFLGGHLVGFTQGISAAKSYDDIIPSSSSRHIIVQSCEDRMFIIPDTFPFFPAPPTKGEGNSEPSQLKPLPRVETKL